MKIQKNLLLELAKLYREHLAQELADMTGSPIEVCRERLVNFKANPKHFEAFCKEHKNKIGKAQ